MIPHARPSPGARIAPSAPRPASLRRRAGITMAEILIATAMVGVIVIPVVISILNSTKKIHTMGYEVVAESLARTILDEILKKVPFDHVNPGKMTVGADASCDVILDLKGYKKVAFDGNVSGSVIQIDDAQYKWEFDIADLKGSDIFVSCWRVERKGYSDDVKEADPKSLDNKAVIKNFEAEEFSKRKKQILMKTIRFKISWRNIIDQEWLPQNRLVLLTRKARLEDISGM